MSADGDPSDTLLLPEASQAIANALAGPNLVGWLGSVLLFGMVVPMLLSYTSSKVYARDSRRKKVLLWLVFTFNFAAAAVNFAQAYWHGTQQNRTHVALLLGQPLDCLPPALTGTVAILVQLILAQRCSKLFIDREALRITFLVVISSFAIVAYCASIVVTIFFGLYSAGIHVGANTTETVYLTNLVAGVWLCISAAVDCTITITLCLILRPQLSGFNANTDHVLRRVMRLALKTAAYTSIFAVAGAFTAIVFPESDLFSVNIFFAFTFPLPSLYTISLLATLSDRKRLQDLHTQAHGHPTPFLNTVCVEVNIAYNSSTAPGTGAPSTPRMEARAAGGDALQFEGSRGTGGRSGTEIIEVEEEEEEEEEDEGEYDEEEEIGKAKSGSVEVRYGEKGDGRNLERVAVPDSRYRREGPWSSR